MGLCESFIELNGGNNNNEIGDQQLKLKIQKASPSTSAIDCGDYIQSKLSNSRESIILASAANRKLTIAIIDALICYLSSRFCGSWHRLIGLLTVTKLILNTAANTSWSLLHSTLLQAICFVRLPIDRLKELRANFSHHQRQLEEDPEKSVSVHVLAEPPAGTPIRADIIFCHGVYGSSFRTWRQGIWSSNGLHETFDRPRRPSIRPLKRRRSSRSDIMTVPNHGKRFRPYSGDVNNGQQSAASTSEDDVDSVDEKQLLDEMVQQQRPCRFRAFSLCDDRHPETLNFQSAQPKKSESTQSLPAATASAPQKETSSPTMCWPSDWLPHDCPGVRVIAVNYTCDPYLWRPFWIRKRNRTALGERAREMMDLLAELGVGRDRPIVWVGHSKGGIYIKKILVDAWESGKAEWAALWQSSRGCLFYSVPHRGSAVANINLPFIRQSVEIVEIRKNNPAVMDLHRRFVALYRSGLVKLNVFSFVETALSLLCLRVVRVDSADPGIGEVCGVRLDHRSICKPSSRNCMLYTKLTDMINNIS